MLVEVLVEMIAEVLVEVLVGVQVEVWLYRAAAIGVGACHSLTVCLSGTRQWHKRASGRPIGSAR